ncbi:MAG TPA: hypothetical protein IGP91_09030, partial [Thermosynechococcus sp. M46_R2017_013]|nr:hypothetical protein [Thermosynechococcus sp. M46_R2017_013]
MQGSTFWQRQWKSLVAILAVFLLCFYLPVEQLQQWPRSMLPSGTRCTWCAGMLKSMSFSVWCLPFLLR